MTGSLIHIGSQMGHVGGPNRSLYCASKWALEGMSKAFALDLAAHGIRSNTICPTFIDTPLTRPFFEDVVFKASVFDKIKLGRIGRVEDLMGAIVFLASDASLLRSHGVQLADVGKLVGPPAVLGGIAGGVLSGMLAAWLIKRSGNRRAGLIVPIVALPLAIPAYATFLFAPDLATVVVAIGIMNFLLSSGLGPCVALAVSLVRRRGAASHRR